MKTYKAGELREDMLVVPVHELEAATPSEDGWEVPEIVGKFCWMDGDMGDGYYVQCVHDLPEHIIDNERELMTVAQCKRIVAAKDAEIASLKDGIRMLEESHGALFDELRAKDFAQPARQVGGDEPVAYEIHWPAMMVKGPSVTFVSAADFKEKAPHFHTCAYPLYRAALAPAAVAVVMPDEVFTVDAPQMFAETGADYAWVSGNDAYRTEVAHPLPLALLNKC